jgi:hypothetical protein
MYDYYLGGKDHWQADREAAEQILAIAPEVRAMARANRAFLRRAVTYLAKEKGVTQFLDVGTGIPTSPNVHETAAAHARDTRVVYADNDPVIHAHANALLTGTGTTRIILAEVTGTATTTYDSATAPLVLRPPPGHRGVPGRLHRRAPGPGPGAPLAPRRQAEASRPQEDRHLRRRRRQELTARPGCGSSSSRTIRSFARPHHPLEECPAHAASVMWAASMPAAPRNSAGVPEPGISRRALSSSRRQSTARRRSAATCETPTAT